MNKPLGRNILSAILKTYIYQLVHFPYIILVHLNAKTANQVTLQSIYIVCVLHNVWIVPGNVPVGPL